ncbi:MAG: BMC domain-containing protein [Hespellia sp.]|nr:BMC domain-containing protein [Hespellia sp.]
MSQKSLGLVETYGLLAAVEAADTAVKSANVQLVGYEQARGSGLTTIKVEGDVGAVKAAVAAAVSAAGKVGTVASFKVIARPAEGIEHLIHNQQTVGGVKPKKVAEEADAKKTEVKSVKKISVKAAEPAKVEAKAEVPKPSETKTEQAKQNITKLESAKQNTPKAEAPKQNMPKAEAPKQNAPKAEASKQNAPKAEATKQNEPKVEVPKQNAEKKEEKPDDKKK